MTLFRYFLTYFAPFLRKSFHKWGLPLKMEIGSTLRSFSWIINAKSRTSDLEVLKTAFSHFSLLQWDHSTLISRREMLQMHNLLKMRYYVP